MTRVRALLLSLLVSSLLVAAAGACSSSVTKQEYLDHAMKFSSAAKTAKQKAEVRKLWECMWPDVEKDKDLLDKFMAAEHSDQGPLSTQLSKLMYHCMTVGRTPPSTTTSAPG